MVVAGRPRIVHRESGQAAVTLDGPVDPDSCAAVWTALLEAIDARFGALLRLSPCKRHKRVLQPPRDHSSLSLRPWKAQGNVGVVLRQARLRGWSRSRRAAGYVCRRDRVRPASSEFHDERDRLHAQTSRCDASTPDGTAFSRSIHFHSLGALHRDPSGLCRAHGPVNMLEQFDPSTSSARRNASRHSRSSTWNARAAARWHGPGRPKHSAHVVPVDIRYFCSHLGAFVDFPAH